MMWVLGACVVVWQCGRARQGRPGGHGALCYMFDWGWGRALRIGKEAQSRWKWGD